MRNTYNLILLVVVYSVACLLPLNAIAANDDEGEALRPIFINLTSGEDDLQKASMTLMLASNSLDSGRTVTVFVNVHATQLIDLVKVDLAMYRREVTFHEKFAELIDAGAVILACPYCLERNDLKVEDIIEGVEPADGDNFFPPIDDGAAVFSY